MKKDKIIQKHSDEYALGKNLGRLNDKAAEVDT